MENPTFLGVNFRSTAHLVWFFLSLAAMAMSLPAAFWPILQRRIGIGPDPNAVLQYPLGAHLGVALLALILTRGGTREYRSYSVDCIWWNALMSAFYGAIMLVANRLR
jgi:hypothetical protein